MVRSSKHHKRKPRMTGGVYQADKIFGYFPKPNATAYFTIRQQKPVPLSFDQYGFRVPKKKWRIPKMETGGVLFLGCSFTLGDGVPAEETFSYITGEELNLWGMNAGMSGGGLCQMVLRARQEIPRFKPKWVVVQYSDWMIRRSQRYYRPTAYGKTPGPFFYERNGNIYIHPPVFTTKNFALPIATYSRKGFLPFTWHVGIPLYLHDDFHVLSTSIKRLLGMIPKPAESKESMVNFTYHEIAKVCRENDANMVVLKLYYNLNDMPSYEIDDLGYPVVDTRKPLVSALPQPTIVAWDRQYKFMSRSGRRVIDIHPTIKAHRIIAQALINKIRSLADLKE